MTASSLRIALISEHASPLTPAGSLDAGAQNIYAAQLARGLAAQGHQVDVLTRRDDATQPGVVEVQPGVRVLHLDAGPPQFLPKEALLPHMPAFAASAGRWFAMSPPYDVQHANFFLSGWVGLALRRRFGVPLVTTFHTLGLVRHEHLGETGRFPAERVAIEREVVHGSDRIIAKGPQEALDLRRRYGAEAARLVTVPCGVDLEEFQPGDSQQARARLGLERHDFVVLHVGRLLPRKGLDTVVRALPLLPPTMQVRLVVVGGDSVEPDDMLTPEIGRMRALAAELGVTDRVHFVGQRSSHQLRDWYVAANAFVTTPGYEPFGLTALEAMACAVPVIGSAVGGLAHTVVDSVTGFLVPPRDPVALAARLMLLHTQPELAAAQGRAGRLRVRESFTWAQCVSQLAAVYAQLHTQSHPPRHRAIRAETSLPVSLGSAMEPLQGVGA